MKALKRIIFSALILAIAFSGASCVKTNYTTQSKANSYNDYKSNKYKMKNKKKKVY